MRLFGWLCLLRGWWNTLTLGVSCSGHEMHNEEEDVPALVTTGRCADCGSRSVVWKRGQLT